MIAKLLLVDDEPNIIRSLSRALRKEPYKILSANSGDEALQILSGQSVDVVISDEKMPGLSGTEFLSIVSKKFPETIRIILTGNANIEMAIHAINEGKIYRFLRKPCHELELVSTIKDALKHRNLLLKTKQLLKIYKQQATVLNRLEHDHPGIACVDKDEKGAIVINSPLNNFEDVVQEIELEINRSKSINSV